MSITEWFVFVLFFREVFYREAWMDWCSWWR